jgi:hypothetical protein
MRVSPAIVADIEWATLALTGLIALVSLVSHGRALGGGVQLLRVFETTKACLGNCCAESGTMLVLTWPRQPGELVERGGGGCGHRVGYTGVNRAYSPSQPGESLGQRGGGAWSRRISPTPNKLKNKLKLNYIKIHEIAFKLN